MGEPTQGGAGSALPIDADDPDARKRCYLETVVRRLTLKAPGWDAGQPNWSRKKDLDLNTICEAQKYQTKPVHSCEKIALSSLLPPTPPFSGIVGVQPPVPPDQDNSVQHGIQRMELIRRDPSRAGIGQDVFPWAVDDTTSIDNYWYTVTFASLRHLYLLKDTADFHANDLLRLIYLYAEVPQHLRAPVPAWRSADTLDTVPYFSKAKEADILEELRNFKYWLDEPFKVLDSQDDDDPKSLFNARKSNAPPDTRPPGFKPEEFDDEMTFWSENHQNLFATAEYLVGQWMRDEKFLPGRKFRSNGDDPNAFDYTGQQRMDRARPRILTYLNSRLRFGFSEWNAPGYYTEHLQALFNLADFCLDEQIRTRAWMVIDLLMFDLARLSQGGSFGATAGRCYFEHRNCGWEQSIGDVIELAFGTRAGTYAGDNDPAATMLASSQYQVPDVLISIARERPDAFVDRSRVSIDFGEAAAYGISLTDETDVIMNWWPRASWFAQDDIKDATWKASDKYKLGGTNPFGIFRTVRNWTNVIRGANYAINFGVLGTFAPIAILLMGDIPNPSSFAEGSALTHANLYTFRNGDVALSSVQNWHAGQWNLQSQFCQATLGMDAVVWTSKPPMVGPMFRARLTAAISGAAGGSIVGTILGTAVGIVTGLGFLATAAGGAIGAEAGGVAAFFTPEILRTLGDENFMSNALGHDGPTFWHGSVTAPRVVQHESAAIIAYRSEGWQVDMFGDRTHAWFPKAAFDADADGDPYPSLTCLPSLSSNCDDGAWIFGRKGDGYVGLYSAQKPRWADSDSDWADREILAEGKRNVFILQVGNAHEYGSYQEFKRQVLSARIHVNGLNWAPADFECSYDIPKRQRLELHYDADEDEVRLGGQPFDDSRFPRFENQYIRGGRRVLWRQFAYTIEHDGKLLSHDFSGLKDDADATVTRSLTAGQANRLLERLTCQPQAQIPDKGSSDTPSLAVAGSTAFTTSVLSLFMAWKGTEGDSGLYWSMLASDGWSPQVKIEGMGSSHGPALTAYRVSETATGLFMAWKGVRDDHNLYWARNWLLTSDGWEPQRKVAGAGSSARPTMIEYRHTVYLVWKGVPGDSGIYVSWFNGVDWAPPQKIADVGTSHALELVVFQDRLYLFWKGIEDDHNVYFSWMTDEHGTSWAPQQKVASAEYRSGESVPIGSSNGPSAVAFENALLLAWKGVPDDSGLYVTTLEDDAWYGQIKLKGTGSSTTPATAVYDGRVHMVWKGIDDDHALYGSVFDVNAEGAGIFFLWPA